MRPRGKVSRRTLHGPATVSILSDLMAYDSGNCSAAPSLPDIHHIHNAHLTSRVGRSFVFLFVSQGIAGGLVGNFTLTNFFAIATQSSQPHRIFHQRDKSLNGLRMRFG
jgi:hypothetical protein